MQRVVQVLTVLVAWSVPGTALAASPPSNVCRPHQSAWACTLESLAAAERYAAFDDALARANYTLVHFVSFYADGGLAVHGCAMESMVRALTNPEMRPMNATRPENETVAVLVHVLDKNASMRVHGRLAHELDVVAGGASGYRAVHVSWVRVPFEHLVAGTPLGPFFASSTGQAASSIARADAVRIGILSRYGGLYLDLDIITVRDFTALTDFVSRQSWGSRFVNNAHLLFREPHHPLVEVVAANFVRDFNPHTRKRQANGPDLWTRTLEENCGGKMPFRRYPDKEDQLWCSSFDVLPYRETHGIGITGTGLYLRSPEEFKPSRLKWFVADDRRSRLLGFHLISSWTWRVEKRQCLLNTTRYARSFVGRVRARNCPLTFTNVITDSFLPWTASKPDRCIHRR